ncbi:MAG: hypothetical protein K6B14_09555 [Lachnospiraceae bacterium]|nr:hypothetical protein [Lachnospiraceae bacterium]
MTVDVTKLISEHPVKSLKESWGCIYECANKGAGDIPVWTQAAADAGYAPEERSFSEAIDHVKGTFGDDFVCFGARPDIYLPTEIVRMDDFAILEAQEFNHPSIGGFLFFKKESIPEEVTYIKYNEQRAYEYRLQTEILRCGDEKKVRKNATCTEALPHLHRILDNVELLHDLYREIWMVPVERDDDTVYFMFVEGESLLSDVDFVSDSPRTIVKKVKKAMGPIFSFKQEYITTFRETEGFRELFGSYPYLDYDRRAVTRCNLDCNFDNFGKKDGYIYCFDYEWAVDFPVPIDYLKVRTLRFLYESRQHELSVKFDRLENFIFAFGFIPEEYNVYTRMEEAFQQYVHGRDYCFRYTTTFSDRPVVHTPPLTYTTPKWKWMLKKIYRSIYPVVLPLE